MNKITVYRTHIEICNYNRWDCPPIEKLFSIYDPTYHRYYDKGILYDESRKILFLPRGTNIPWLENLFAEKAYFDQSIDPVGDIGKIMLKYTPRDDVQRQAIRFMIHPEEYTMMSINLNTGKGKTFCAIATMAYFHMRSIVITDSIQWLEQWKRFILDYTNIDESEIYFISGSPSIIKLYKRDISKYKVFLCTHSTIQSFGSRYGWDEITKLFQYLQIGIKFFDEAHLNFDNMLAIDCFTNTFITYYLTATPGRSNLLEDNIYGIYFKNVPSIDLYVKERDAHSRYAAILYKSQPTKEERDQCCSKKYGLDRNKYTNYIVTTENFQNLLHILIMQAISKPGKNLFYIGTNAAILEVRDWIYENYPELWGNVGIYTSIISPELKEKELNKQIILSTTKSAGACVDISGLVETVCLAEPFRSKVLAQQTFGRNRNNNTIYKDIVDTSFYHNKKFYHDKKPVFEKYATDCIEITITPEELKTRADKIREDRKSIIQPIIFDDDRI